MNLNKIKSIIEKTWRYNDLSGMVIAFGNLETSHTISKGLAAPPKIFHVASISKLFTTTLIGLSASNGLLKLSDPAFKWLPLIDRRITIWHLLNHCSGISSKTCNWSYSGNLGDYVLSNFSAYKKVTLPHSFQYSDLNYEILGYIIEKLWDKPFESIAYELIFKKYQMNNSFFNFKKNIHSDLNDIEIIKQKNIALLYSKNLQNDFELLTPYPFSLGHMPSSTLHSTTEDLSKFARLLLNKSLPLMDNCFSQPFYGHDGGDIGTSSSFWVNFEKNFYSIAISNCHNPAVKRANHLILDELLEDSL